MSRFAHCRLPLSLLTLAIASPLYAGTVSTDGVDLVIKTKGGFEVKQSMMPLAFSSVAAYN